MAITIGIDLGTSKLTALAVEMPSGCVVANASTPTPASDTSSGVTTLLRDALQLLQKVAAMLSDRVSQVVGIGITGQQHGIVLIDDLYRPLTPLYGWQDKSGDLPHATGTWSSYARDLVSDAPNRTGCRLRSGYGVVTLFARRAELPPSFIACTIMDLFGTILTGRHPVTEPTCAASLGSFNIRKGEWDTPTLEALGMQRAWFPDVAPAGTLLGGLIDTTEARTALTSGTPVFVGVGDNQASFLGSVDDPESTALVNIGTGGQVAMYSPIFAIDDQIEARPYFGGGYLLVSAGQTGGAAFATFADGFAHILPQGDRYEILLALARSVPPGCQGLRCEPFFRGTRTDPNRRASFTHITDINFTPGHLARAVLEGMARVLAEGLDRIARLNGRVASSLVGAGNGVRANPLLVECLADAFGTTPRVPAHREEAAFGACLIASVGAGLFKDFLHAGQSIYYKEHRSFSPDQSKISAIRM